eukprot:TRINITY_DN20603_c0_g1_i2.p2 TRINITY_DN20603_c0_g1~~TRINITY_DN20603_c0_g1_i2.p2  ORF type:complete len:131 (+),score=1.37 TRINITY_DN20603_c0_g1_i2:42-395(+)
MGFVVWVQSLQDEIADILCFLLNLQVQSFKFCKPPFQKSCRTTVIFHQIDVPRFLFDRAHARFNPSKMVLRQATFCLEEIVNSKDSNTYKFQKIDRQQITLRPIAEEKNQVACAVHR